MNWWNLIKNAKLSNRAKETGKVKDGDVSITFDDDDDCCEEFWKTIQAFKNEHMIVFKVLVSLRYDEVGFKNKKFDRIGHMYYEGDTLIMPMSSDKPCFDSRQLFNLIEDLFREYCRSDPKKPAVWKEFGNHVTGYMHPFLPRHYLKANLEQINEWPKLVDKFLKEFVVLSGKFDDCEELGK